MKITFIDIGGLNPEILLIEEQKLMLKIKTSKCCGFLRIFPFQCEGRCDVCCGETSGTKFQSKALRLNAPSYPHPSFFWNGPGRASAIYQEETYCSLFYYFLTS